ncbi:DUF2388 domain-containing protein [Pseudomonas fluorescens]|uniref:DUF2388 domain-containing protein n=1 Tax=Pseudomonas fluorescens TaxID=294 RepID=A0A423MEE4_PSEFL|nr:DUF2388 domain-containing protein [Pseudomonas fluorescens]RON81639.1 hypothetical protein BK670_15855 [Pseudomonas fluorescens]
MPAFSFSAFKRFTLLALFCFTSDVYAHCDGFCMGRTETPWEVTQFSGLSIMVLLLTPFSATNNTTESFKRVYSAEEQEDARLYLASDGMLQAAYFTSALQRYRQESPNSALNDLAVAALISAQ